ncbi:glycosyltransferase [Thiohalobacter thiocyanaticus]|uniref:Glycosyltransferase n=1 Tax=Thiohalobacter thiocyanaticus TaxID=585455 RepID=A0A1Z4VMY5_9GAMM|nr:glycosyltransferase [Thiohalobacter thiocyanaticus]BAZ92986.1 glycosyltransferase [Thiohalobacter thiocyanaticus]
MRKVLSIHWGFSLGGVAQYAATLERVRARMPLQLRSLCLLPRGRVVDEATLAKLDVRVLPVRSLADLTWIRGARRVIAEEAPDCVLSHGFNGHLVALLGTRGRSTDVIRLATYHGSYHPPSRGKRLVAPLYNGFTHWYLRSRAAGVLNVAQFCADFLADHGVPASKLTVVHNGIPDLKLDPGVREAIRREWGFGPEHTLIGVASRLDPVKGLEYLLQAFAGVAQDHLGARLVLMGDGTVRSDLEAQAGALGIRDRVLFTGMRADVPQCLAALDVFALPSLAEYHSIGLLEAMRAGLPIVATDVGGNTESVRDGQEGLIVAPADAVGLKSALARLLDDRDLCARLGQAARSRFVSEFTEYAMLAKTASWLSRVCGD